MIIPPGYRGVGFGVDGKFRVHASLLKAWHTCTTKAVTRYRLHLTTPGERAELLSGTCLHAALETFLNPACGGNVGEAVEVFRRQYEGWASVNVPAEDRLSLRNVGTIVQAWCEAHPHLGNGNFKGLPWTIVPEHIEVRFELPLDDQGDILLVGRIDLVPRYQDGWVIVDHKTTGAVNAFWMKQWQRDGQPMAYLWGARRLLEGQRVYGVFINAIELSRLPSDPTRKCKDHKLPYAECSTLHAKWEVSGLIDHGEAELAAWHADALAAAIKMREVFEHVASVHQVQDCAQEGVFNGGCRFCELPDICNTGRQPHLMQANLISDLRDPPKV